MSTAPFKRVADGLDVAPARAEVHIADTVGRAWDQETRRQTFPGSAHTDTRTIYLRWSAEWTPEYIFNSYSAEDQPARHALPFCSSLTKYVYWVCGGQQLGRAMLVNLKPGGTIAPHRDEGRYAEYFDRFHCVLQSDMGNSFMCGDESVSMSTGEIWWFDHHQTHSVTNQSTRDRIHLIVDMVAPKWSHRVEPEPAWSAG